VRVRRGAFSDIRRPMIMYNPVPNNGQGYEKSEVHVQLTLLLMSKKLKGELAKHLTDSNFQDFKEK
jgi:hypothetical protein